MGERKPLSVLQVLPLAAAAMVGLSRISLCGTHGPGRLRERGLSPADARECRAMGRLGIRLLSEPAWTGMRGGG